MERINIITYADGLYIQHACIMLMSLGDVVSANREYKIFVFHTNCEQKAIDKLRKTLTEFLPKNVSFKLIQCNFNISSQVKSKRKNLNASIYDKVLIYDRVPQDISKVVFFDADIVLLKDPALLFDMDLEGNYVGAVRDQVFENFLESEKKVLGIEANQYFNTGVMIVNMDKWRADEISKKSLDFAIEKWDLTPYHDQDAFNYVIKGKWKEISPLWNPRISNSVTISGSKKVYTKMEVYEKNISYLVHYSGPHKPWFYMSFHPKKDDYLKYLKLSAFKDYKFPDYNFENVIKKQIIALRRKFYFFRKKMKFI